MVQTNEMSKYELEINQYINRCYDPKTQNNIRIILNHAIFTLGLDESKYWR